MTTLLKRKQRRFIPARRFKGRLSVAPGLMILSLLAWMGFPCQADPKSVVVRHANTERFYEDSHKVPPTLAEIKATAEKGDCVSQTTLGDMCVEQGDWATASSWYRKAAQQGNTNAQYHLGEILWTGQPKTAHSATAIPQATDEAVLWLWRAANAGHPGAQLDLGSAYEQGEAVTQDPVEAYRWLALAAKQTNKVAQTSLDRLILKMTSAQVNQAKALADAFVPDANKTLPEPAYMSQLKLKGISGVGKSRLAIINNRTLGVGEKVAIKLDAKSVQVRCVEIREKSVIISVDLYQKELPLIKD